MRDISKPPMGFEGMFRSVYGSVPLLKWRGPFLDQDDAAELL